MKTQAVGVVLIVVCVAFCLDAGVAQAADPAPVRATPAQIAQAQGSTQFKDALKILDEQDEAVNLNTVRVVTIPTKIGTRALHFDITRKGSTKQGEFQRLVNVERPAKPPLVYFDKLTGIAAATFNFCRTEEGGWKPHSRAAAAVVAAWNATATRGKSGPACSSAAVPEKSGA